MGLRTSNKAGIDLGELKQLIDRAIYASSKKEAQPSIKRLEFIASGIRGKIDPYLSGKLREAIGYAAQASGRVRDKEHWIRCAEQAWYVFETRLDDEPIELGKNKAESQSAGDDEDHE